MALSYINSGSSLSASRWNLLIEDLDNALSALYSGKSPYAWGASLDLLHGIEFVFGNPSKRKILAGDTREYNHAQLRNIAATLSLVATDESTLEWTFIDPTIVQYEQAAPMFGLGDSFKNDCEINDCWLFDFSLEPFKAEYAFPGATLGWMRKYSQGRNQASLAPSEQLHDRAVAEIIIEGWPSSLFQWPAEWSKFGCLRFHNLDRQNLTVLFADGTRVVIPELGCKVVRQIGAIQGRRTSWNTTGTYLWRFVSGDAPIWRADRNRDRGVWGCSGYSSLDSIALLHDWLDAPGHRFHFDPRVKWDGASKYAATFGALEDSDVVAKYSLHTGTYRSLKFMPDQSWQSSVGAIAWAGNGLVASDLVAEIEGSAVTWKSKHDGTHDVVALTSNMLPAGSTNVGASGITVDASAPDIAFARIDASTFNASTRYYGESGEPIDLILPIATAGPVTLSMPTVGAFSRTLKKCKELTTGGTDGPSSSLSTFTDRSLTFDGLALTMSWSRTTPLTVLMDTGVNSVPSNLAAFDLSADEWTFHNAIDIAIAATDYALMPGRIDRHSEFGLGYMSGSTWIFSRHVSFTRGTAEDAQDWQWEAPNTTKPGIRYHGQAPTQIETRNSPVIPVGTNWIRAVSNSISGEWWGTNRISILAGETNQEDARRTWRMPGAIEHYNHIAARLNALKAISPYQFTDLIYYGQPFASVEVTNNGGVATAPRFAARLDQSATAKARAEELHMAIFTASHLPVLAELLAFDSTGWLGPSTTWLQTALPQIGFPAGNTLPTYEWTTIGELAKAAQSFGVPYNAELFGVPQRLGLYQSEGLAPGVDSLWYSSSTFTALWDTASEMDFYRSVAAKTSIAICEWTMPIVYTDTHNDNRDYIQAQFPQGQGGELLMQYPNGASGARGVVVSRASYFPSAPTGWIPESRSKLLIQPAPHFRYSSQTSDRFGLLYVPIAAQEAAPQSPAAVPISSVVSSNSTAIVTHSECKTLLDLVNGDSDSWGSSTMCYVTLIPRVAIWRS